MLTETRNRLPPTLQLVQSLLEIRESLRCPLLHLSTAGSQTVRGYDDCPTRIRDRFGERCKGTVYSCLVLFELGVGEERIRPHRRLLLRRYADSIRLGPHCSGLTAISSLLEVVSKEKCLVGIRSNVVAGDEPYVLNLDLNIHILPEGTDRHIAPDEIIPPLQCDDPFVKGC